MDIAGILYFSEMCRTFCALGFALKSKSNSIWSSTLSVSTAFQNILQYSRPLHDVLLGKCAMSRLYFITPGDDLLYCKTFSPLVSVSSFCPPYSAFVVKAIKGLFCRGWGYFCTFSRPCSCCRFWVGSSFFLCVCPHMLMQNSSLLSSLTVVWSRGVDIIVQQSE